MGSGNRGKGRNEKRNEEIFRLYKVEGKLLQNSPICFTLVRNGLDELYTKDSRNNNQSDFFIRITYDFDKAGLMKVLGPQLIND